MQLYDRTMSSIPVSIGTSLALESIFLGSQKPYDPERPIPQKIQLTDYQETWINVETLLRNIAGAVDRTVYAECTPGHIADILKTEIDIIRSVFATEGHGVCTPVFYLCDYESIRDRYKGKVHFRESTTLIQKSLDFKAKKTLEKLKHMNAGIEFVKYEIKPLNHQKISSLIITHIPFDLTNYEHFRKLDLLESHTGVLKTRTQWNTKYAPCGSELMTHLPFHRELLFVFGDKNQIEPLNRKIRGTILEISIKRKWTPVTRMDQIRQHYREANLHPADLQILLSF